MAYRRWLSTLSFEHPAQQIAFQGLRLTPSWMANGALKRVEEQIFGLLPDWNLRPVVDALQAMRGIALINAVVLVTEARRFHSLPESAPAHVAYFGLVPGERSSGEAIRRSGITKTGNSYARRALVEGAWATYRMRARIGRHKVDRSTEALPKIVRDIGWKAQSSAVHSLSAPAGSRQDSQCRQCRHSPRDGGGFIWSIAAAPGSIGAAGGMTHPATARTKGDSKPKNQPRRGMRRWGRDNAGEPSCAL